MFDIAMSNAGVVMSTRCHCYVKRWSRYVNTLSLLCQALKSLCQHVVIAMSSAGVVMSTRCHRYVKRWSCYVNTLSSLCQTLMFIKISIETLQSNVSIKIYTKIFKKRQFYTQFYNPLITCWASSCKICSKFLTSFWAVSILGRALVTAEVKVPCMFSMALIAV